MKLPNGLVVALVLLGAAGIYILSLTLENYQLKVEIGSLKSSTQAAAAAPRPQAPAAAPSQAVAAGPDREVTEVARQLMVDALVEETGAEKKFWIRVEPRDPEASAFAGQIAAVFKDNGWDVKVLGTDGLRYKPGLLMLTGGEDEPPSYVVAAQKAVQAIGQEVTTGSGYLSYYAAKKAESPDWRGTEFLAEQTYVLLVGRKP